MKIRIVLNGKPAIIDTDPTRRLLDILRNDYNLTGVKEGCGEGECGACSVLIDGRIANSCIVPAGAVEGSEIITIEGYRETARYRALRDAFEEAGAVQCGFCTPGFIMAAEALLRENANPGEDDIRRALSGNLCRCTGYSMIIDAVKIASAGGKELW